MKNARQAFETALGNFPSWGDIRKRPWTSIGGKYLLSIMEENEYINEAFEEFKKSFFLKSYIGKEDKILCQVYVSQIGTLNGFRLVQPERAITSNSRTFLSDPLSYAMYQDGYLVISYGNGENEDEMITYIHNNETYQSKLEKRDLWNIFDEFALFSSLVRYPGETNEQLVQRILASFKRPTNGTENGLKNAIINAVTNYENVKPSEIIFEKPNENNMHLLCDEGISIYEKLSHINKDIAREKVWDQTTWENPFKKMEYIPNKWDKVLEGYQHGTGQKDDLLVRLSTDSENTETTDISVVGYIKSKILINDYVRRQGIRKKIPLQLTKYKDELVARNIEYKIEAAPAIEIDPNSVYIQGARHVSGQTECLLSDVMVSKEELTEIMRGQVPAGQIYNLEFHPKDAYSDAVIERCNFVQDDGTVTSLLIEKGPYKWDNGIFRNTDVKIHAEKLSDFVGSRNIISAETNGVTLGTESTSGELSLNVSGMAGMPVHIGVSCDETDYTDNTNYVSVSGGFRHDSHSYICDSPDSESTLEVRMECSSLSFELVRNMDSPQGAIAIQLFVNGVLDKKSSGIFTDAKKYSYTFGNLSNVRLVITKVGLYSTTIRDIRAARNKITCWLDHGDITELPEMGYVQLPMDMPQSNTLHIMVDSYSNFPPIIEYVHVGASLAKSYYLIKSVSTESGGYFDIRSNCIVRLVNRTSGKDIEENSNYITYPLYRNNTGHNVTAYIDLSSYSSITSTSRPVSRGAYRGVLLYTITLAPKESVDILRILGETRILRERQKISHFLHTSATDKVYISSNTDGFVIQDKNGRAVLKTIPRSDLMKNADEFIFDGLPKKTSGAFRSSSGVSIGISTAQSFNVCYAVSTDNEKYIAYNNLQMFQPVVDGIQMVNTFSPVLDMNRLMFYKIQGDIIADGEVIAKALFAHEASGKISYDDWSLGQSPAGIRVEYYVSYTNAERFQIELDNLNESFTISNNIDLRDKYVKDSVSYELSRYIIDPPEDMQVTYKDSTVMEPVVVKTDQFNKLYYSNVKSVKLVTCEGIAIPETDYEVLHDAGIIVWKKWLDLVGKTVNVVYTYRYPVSLEFKSLDSLYELVGYSLEAYEAINDTPVVISGLKDGDHRNVIIQGKVPDRLTVRLSNKNFHAIVSWNQVTVSRLADAPVAIVHSGYYYDKDKEYYLFENDNQDKLDSMNNVELERIERTANAFRGIQASSNYVFDSVMTNEGRQETLCHIDCVRDKHRIKGLSRLKNITSCESYQQWNDFNMDISFVDGHNGLGLKFDAAEKASYALLDLTPYIEPGVMISFTANGNLQCDIMKEILIQGQGMVKSNFVQKFKECDKDGEYRWYVFDTIEEDTRYYLCIRGNGTIDDIICREKEEFSLEDLHKKPISALKFDIPERLPKSYEQYMEFDCDGNELHGLEIDAAGMIETGSTVDWGLTLVEDCRPLFERFTVENIDLRKDVFRSVTKEGRIISPWIYIRNTDAIDTLYIKINDVIVDPMRYFGVHVRSADSLYGANQREIHYSKKTNLAEIKSGSLRPYIQIEVEIAPERVINSIEVYAKYVENENPLHVTPNADGYLLTKVYNTVVAANYRPKYMTGSVTHSEHISIFVRGYRQDKEHGVWTNWYECYFDKDMIFSEDSHVFENYQYFQFRIAISDEDASIKIDNFVFEVVD